MFRSFLTECILYLIYGTTVSNHCRHNCVLSSSLINCHSPGLFRIVLSTLWTLALFISFFICLLKKARTAQTIMCNCNFSIMAYIKWIYCKQATLHAVTIYATKSRCVRENKTNLESTRYHSMREHYLLNYRNLHFLLMFCSFTQ